MKKNNDNFQDQNEDDSLDFDIDKFLEELNKDYDEYTFYIDRFIKKLSEVDIV